MSDEKITVIGLYNYDQHLFDGLHFPAGIDKTTAVNTILINCGEFEPLFADYDFFKFAIGTWSNKWQHTFEKWIKAQSIDYEPLYNYDRYEKYTDDRTGTASTTEKGKGTETDTGTVTNEHTVSAYDSSSYQPEDKNVTTNNLKNDSSFDNSGTQNTNEKITHDAHLYGNIGVTTSQQMLKDELEISAWNIYEHISDLFKTELTILVY